MCVCNDSMIYNDNTMSNNLQNRNKTSLTKFQLNKAIIYWTCSGWKLWERQGDHNKHLRTITAFPHSIIFAWAASSWVYMSVTTYVHYKRGVQVQSLAWRHSSSETWYMICAGCCRVRSSARFRNYNWLQISKFIICTYAWQPRKITKEKQKLSGMLICGFKKQNKQNNFLKMYIALFLGCFSTSLDKFVCSCCNKFALKA